MKGTKRDFNQLKLDFFSSEEDLKGFLEKRLNKKIDGNISRKTAGRVKERKEYRDKIYNLALQDGEKELKEKAKGRLLKMENLYFNLALSFEKKLKDPEKLSISDLYTIRKIARTEKGLPINITRYDPIEINEGSGEKKETKKDIEDRYTLLETWKQEAHRHKIHQAKAEEFDKMGYKLDDKIIKEIDDNYKREREELKKEKEEEIKKLDE